MSVRSEVIALLDPVFGGRVYGDAIPAGGMEFPYAGVPDHLSENPALRGNRKVLAWRRTGQVDVWEAIDDEDPGLLDAVIEAIDGRPVSGAFHLSVLSSMRMVEVDPGVVHHAVTYSVARPR